MIFTEIYFKLLFKEIKSMFYFLTTVTFSLNTKQKLVITVVKNEQVVFVIPVRRADFAFCFEPLFGQTRQRRAVFPEKIHC